MRHLALSLYFSHFDPYNIHPICYYYVVALLKDGNAEANVRVWRNWQTRQV